MLVNQKNVYNYSNKTLMIYPKTHDKEKSNIIDYPISIGDPLISYWGKTRTSI